MELGVPSDGVDGAFGAPAVAELTTPAHPDMSGVTIIGSVSPEEDARANLRRHLHRLQEALPKAEGVQWLDASQKLVGWNARAPVSLDLTRLETVSPNDADAEAVAAAYEELCEGIDDDWILAHRERARGLCLNLLTGLIDRSLIEQRFARGIALAQHMLRIDPFREDAARAIMRLRYESGDRSGALRDFDAFRQRLQAELGVSPMDETQSLYETIRRHASVPSVEGSEKRREVQAMPFLGRSREMGTLRELWRAAARGDMRCAVVCGEAGIGKSRLLQEFARLAEREGARVLAGSTSTPEATPYEPIVAALRPAISEIARLPIDEALTAALASEFPELRTLRSDLPEPAVLLDDRGRARLFDSVSRAITDLASVRPVLLLLEDLHWANDGTFDLLAALIRGCASSAVLILASFREDETSLPLQRFLRRPEARRTLRVGLGRLGAGDCAEVLSAAFAGHPLPPEAIDRAVRLSGGNPLFLGELAREYRAAGLTPFSVDAPDQSIHSVILARLAHVSEQARTFADLAGIAGFVFSIDLVLQVSRWPLAEVLAAVDELLDAFVIRETAIGSMGDYQFSHELVRDALLTVMPPDVRRRRHRRTGRALLSLHAGNLNGRCAAIAMHLEAGGESGDAAAYYAEAARQAHSSFAWLESIEFAQRGLHLAGDPPLRFALLEIVESAQAMLADRESQAETIEALVLTAADIGDSALASAFARQAEWALQCGDAKTEASAIESLEAAAERSGDLRLVRRARRARARYLVNATDYRGAAALMASLNELSTLERTPAERIEDLSLLAHIHGVLAQWKSAKETIAEAERLAADSGSPADRLQAMRSRLRVAIDEPDTAAALSLAPVLLELCHEVGDVEGEANAHGTFAEAQWWGFNVATARHHLGLAIEIFGRIGKPRSLAGALVNAGVLENHVGMLERARAFYEKAFRIYQTFEAPYGVALCESNFAYVAICERDPQRALDHARRSLAYLSGTDEVRLKSAALLNIGIALRELGDVAAARDVLEQSFALYESHELRYEGIETVVELVSLLKAPQDRARAVQLAEQLSDLLCQESVTINMPVHALYVVSDVFEANAQTDRARSLRDRAARVYAERLARLPDEESRKAFAALRYNERAVAMGVGVAG
jgi:DNA-binding SARP family transcriptional activator/tetratricopeptide (TPR) repeat protein